MRCWVATATSPAAGSSRAATAAGELIIADRTGTAYD
jgi:hypothetical protein